MDRNVSSDDDRTSPDARARNGALFALLYDDLRGTAHRLFRRAPRGSEFQATSLVHEAWLRLVPESERRYDEPRAFVVAVTKTMRSILVDRARRRGRLKRGGDREREPVDELLAVYESACTDVLDLSDALEDLARLDPQLGELAELHLIGGLDLAEIAALAGRQPAALQRDWETARRWLARRMGRGGTP